MSITITNRKGRQSIRATGKDAQVLFEAMCKSVERNTAEKALQNAPNAVPNRPKTEALGHGTTSPENATQAVGG